VHQGVSNEKGGYEYFLGQLYTYLTKVLVVRKETAGNALCASAKQAFTHLKNTENQKYSLKFAHFCDLVLRNYEENNGSMQDCLNGMHISPTILARSIVLGTLQAMKLNKNRAHDMFPSLISLLKYEDI